MVCGLARKWIPEQYAEAGLLFCPTKSDLFIAHSEWKKIQRCKQKAVIISFSFIKKKSDYCDTLDILGCIIIEVIIVSCKTLGYT